MSWSNSHPHYLMVRLTWLRIIISENGPNISYLKGYFHTIILYAVKFLFANVTIWAHCVDSLSSESSGHCLTVSGEWLSEEWLGSVFCPLQTETSPGHHGHNDLSISVLSPWYYHRSVCYVPTGPRPGYEGDWIVSFREWRDGTVSYVPVGQSEDKWGSCDQWEARSQHHSSISGLESWSRSTQYHELHPHMCPDLMATNTGGHVRFDTWFRATHSYSKWGM